MAQSFDYRDDDEPNLRPPSHPPLPSASCAPSPRASHGAIEESYEVIVPENGDVVCLSNQRWDGPSLRPQQLMTRFSRQRRVFFIEEAHVGGAQRDRMQVTIHGGVTVLTPLLAAGAAERDGDHRLRLLLNDAMRTYEITNYVLWYYAPVAMAFTRHLFPLLVVWDCIEPSATDGSSEGDVREAQLLAWADLVFTSGSGLHQQKRQLHPHVSIIPSAIDSAHFAKARRQQSDPCDQEDLRRPRIGSHLTLDSRFDLELLRQCSRLRPDWEWILVGPVANGMDGRLPQGENIHYLGAKDFSQLPYYMSGWDAGIVPLVRDASTRFANPPEVAELLAAGRPVVATALDDLRHVYGEQGLVLLADEPREFIRALERVMLESGDLWRAAVDSHQQLNSWDSTHDRMLGLIEAAIAGKQSSRRTAIRT